MGVVWASRTIGLLSLALTGGCALSPTPEDVAAFAAPTHAVAKRLDDVGAAELELVRLADVDRRACHYLRTGVVSLPSAPAKPVGDLQGQAEFVDALADYADALTKAVDPAGAEELESAARHLLASVTTAAGATAALAGAPAPSTWPLFKPATEILIFLGVNAVEYEYRYRIKTIAKDVDLRLGRGIVRLVAAIRKDQATLEQEFAAWKRNRACVLSAMAQGSRYSPAANYDAFVKSYDLTLQFRARLEGLGTLQTVVAQIALAHQIIVRDDVASADKAMGDIGSYSAQLRKISNDLRTR